MASHLHGHGHKAPSVKSVTSVTETTENPPHTDFDPKYDDYDHPTTAPEAQPGHPGHTTPEQDQKVRQLRAELEQLGYTERLDTLCMLRFLRARKFDIPKTKEMYVSLFCVAEEPRRIPSGEETDGALQVHCQRKVEERFRHG
jgi:hypothetical protein